MRKLAQAAMTVVVAGAITGCGSTSPGDQGAPVTQQGQLLYGLEGLLHQRFGTEQVWVSSFANFSCVGESCGPLADFSPYDYVFTYHTTTSLHIARHQLGPDAAFGAHPVPVLLKGLMVACDRTETKYLIRYGDLAGFGLGCLAPITG